MNIVTAVLLSNKIHIVLKKQMKLCEHYFSISHCLNEKKIRNMDCALHEHPPRASIINMKEVTLYNYHFFKDMSLSPDTCTRTKMGHTSKAQHKPSARAKKTLIF
jgi:hypothetical protein